MNETLWTVKYLIAKLLVVLSLFWLVLLKRDCGIGGQHVQWSSTKWSRRHLSIGNKEVIWCKRRNKISIQLSGQLTVVYLSFRWILPYCKWKMKYCVSEGSDVIMRSCRIQKSCCPVFYVYKCVVTSPPFLCVISWPALRYPVFFIVSFPCTKLINFCSAVCNIFHFSFFRMILAVLRCCLVSSINIVVIDIFALLLTYFSWPNLLTGSWPSSSSIASLDVL